MPEISRHVAVCFIASFIMPRQRLRDTPRCVFRRFDIDFAPFHWLRLRYHADVSADHSPPLIIFRHYYYASLAFIDIGQYQNAIFRRYYYTPLPFAATILPLLAAYYFSPPSLRLLSRYITLLFR